MSNVKDEYLLLAVIIVYFYICRHLGLEMNRWISVRAQAGVEMEKKTEKKSFQGEGEEEGRTDFVEDGRSLQQPSVLDSREEDRLRKTEQHGSGMLTEESTDPHHPNQCLAF